MPWAQFDDHFHDSEGALLAGPEACGLHLWATCWSAAHLTDGRLTEPIARRLTESCEHGEEMVKRLVRANLWRIADDNDGWQLVDFLKANRSRGTVEADRAKKAAAGRRGGQVKAQRDRQARETASRPETAPTGDIAF
jgi:hypothetical protein